MAFPSTLPITPAHDEPMDGPIARVVARAANAFGSTRPLVRRLLTLGVVAAQIGVAALVYFTGGTQHSVVHLMYLTLLAAAFLHGPVLGLMAGVAAGLLVGPAMPLDVAAGHYQPTSMWVFRMLAFALYGVLVGAVASLLSLRLARAERLRTALSQTYARNLRLFAGLVAQRDEVTAGHCERVARNAVAIGRELGLSEADLRQLYWSGLLHDLGKIGVPEAILRKPGRLTEEEFAAMRKHACFGRDVLLSVSSTFETIASGVYAHHEKWDGTGYPRRLAGADIPLFGRIIAVADVFEAVTSERPYRRPMSVPDALALIAGGRGSHFDPQVVEAFDAAFAQGAIHLQDTDERSFESFLEAAAVDHDPAMLKLVGEA